MYEFSLLPGISTHHCLRQSWIGSGLISWISSRFGREGPVDPMEDVEAGESRESPEPSDNEQDSQPAKVLSQRGN